MTKESSEDTLPDKSGEWQTSATVVVPEKKKESGDDTLLAIIEQWQNHSQVIRQKKRQKYNNGLPTKNSPADKLRHVIHLILVPYHYKPLGKDEDIRLLFLERGGPGGPGSAADPVVCRLLPCALPPTQGQQKDHKVPIFRYEVVVSYRWDQDAAPTKTIFVKDTEGTKKLFYVRPNLYEALVHLRSTRREDILWIDSLCINQADIDEKSSQVSRMNEIYSKAQSTCIWLGAGNVNKVTNAIDVEGTRRTFNFIRDTLMGPNLDELIADQNHAQDWYSFAELIRDPWFSPRWIVQEFISTEKAATVHWGSEVMQWRDFSDAITLFMEKHDQINALLKISIEDWGTIGDMSAWEAIILFRTNSNISRKSNGGLGRITPALEELYSDLDERVESDWDATSTGTPGYAESVIFSKAGTEISGTSQSSWGYQQPARAMLTDLLMDDVEIQPLLIAAIADSNIGIEKLARNFRKLLLIYSHELLDTADSTICKEAAKLVKTSATYVSTRIRWRFTVQPDSLEIENEEEKAAKKERLNEYLEGLQARDSVLQPKDGYILDETTKDSRSESEDEGEGNEEAITSPLSQVQKYLQTGSPYENLRKSLRSFVKPHQNLEGEDFGETTVGVDADVNIETVEIQNLATGMSAHLHYFRSLNIIAHHWNLPILIDSILEYLPRRLPALADGKTRVKWKCVSQIKQPKFVLPA